MSPKVLVAAAALLTLLLVAYVFAGGSSKGPPGDRLTDQQAGVTTAPEATAQVDDLAFMAEDPVPPPPPEPEIEPASDTRQSPIVRPPPPPLPTAEYKDRQRAQVREQPAALARARAERQAERPKAAAAPPPSRERQARAPTRTAETRAPAPAAVARPSYNCRYARTRSEIAVCNDEGLASLDRQMAAQFNTAVRQGTRAQRDVLERSRLRFLNRRDRCESAGCIAAAYRARMAEINDIAARHWRED